MAYAANHMYEKASIKGSGYNDQEINSTDWGITNYSYKSYQSTVYSQYQKPGYSIDLSSIPNEEHPYFIVLTGTNSQPEAVDGILQVVTQPGNIQKNKSLLSNVYWFNWYGPFKSWRMNVSKEDFISDNASELRYVLNLTKDDLLWNEAGSTLSIEFYPEDSSIDSTHYSYDIRSDNTISGMTGSGFGKNRGYVPLPREVSLEEFLNIEEKFKAQNNSMGIFFSPEMYFKNVTHLTKFPIARNEEGRYNCHRTQEV